MTHESTPTIYYAAVEGDPLDSASGSHVLATTHVCTIEGEDGRHRRMAFIGDTAWCDACQSVGVIAGSAPVPEGRRMLDIVNGGRRQAVGGDVVVCRCERPPHIVATYGRCWRIEDVAGRESAGRRVTPSDAPTTYDEQVRCAGRGATNGYPYFIETEDGRTFSGRLENGVRLPRIQTDVTSDYSVLWGDEALARHEGA
ncbi:PAAR domain-containing protein [Paraburkholderia sp. BL21I4N1]|uniref:PAAR domain-containing protein n=1 Tax=Paraburkholderia sp. BL21I4N1 TaxID=1938801 RepID=UPI000CFDCA23|nr:PAAR domain-containing protein [Paraburkholderia sp. BL21I4N1]PQV54463.1 hypothetical protein B0G83_101645 [Paraburkholderia sp. BL21I4N1]